VKKNIIIVMLALALIIGILSGCTEQKTENNAPKAALNLTAEGLKLTYDGTGSTDKDGDSLTYSWNFGDGTGNSTKATGTYTYAESGEYTVTLTVNDGTVDSDPATENITITNPPSVTLAALPDTITNETELTFNATAVTGDATINETSGYSWYINGTEQVNETTSTFTHTFEDGEYTVEVMVTDEEGLTDTAEVTFTVPTVVAI